MSKELDDALKYIDDKFVIMSVRLNFLTQRLADFEERINKLEGTESEDENTASVCYWCRKNPCECNIRRD